jgi:hypothetical protein
MYGFFEPPPPSRGPDREPPEPAPPDRARPAPPAGSEAWNLVLESAGTNLPIRFLDSPSAVMLAVEDLCWAAAVEDWKHRRPSRWRLRARVVWEAEGARLGAKADRLRRLATEVLREL